MSPRVRTDQVLLRLMIPLGTIVVCAAAALAGHGPSARLVLLLGVLCAVTVWRPEAPAGLGLVVGAGYLWVLDGGDGLSAWVLLAAAGLVLMHCATTVAALGPARMPVERRQLTVWVRRGLLAWLVGALVWLAGVQLRGVAVTPIVFGAGLVLLVGLSLLAVSRLSTSRDPA